VLKKWLVMVGFSWLSWWMFQPVMTQLVVGAAEAAVVPKVAAAAPAAAARTAVSRVRSLRAEIGGHDDPFRACVQVLIS
jgi:hypothetical protein